MYACGYQGRFISVPCSEIFAGGLENSMSTNVSGLHKCSSCGSETQKHSVISIYSEILESEFLESHRNLPGASRLCFWPTRLSLPITGSVRNWKEHCLNLGRSNSNLCVSNLLSECSDEMITKPRKLLVAMCPLNFGK